MGISQDEVSKAIFGVGGGAHVGAAKNLFVHEI